MARINLTGSSRLFINGTLFGNILQASWSSGGDAQRTNTTGGNTGDTVADPTHCTLTAKHAVPRDAAQVKKVERYRQTQEDVRIKLVGANFVKTAIGKIHKSDIETEAGKTEQSLSFSGDEQSIQDS